MHRNSNSARRYFESRLGLQEYSISVLTASPITVRNSPPQLRRGGAPSAGVVVNGWRGKQTMPQIANQINSQTLREANGGRNNEAQANGPKPLT
jgi:hypothetical protein